jgi:hypothetical protein
MACQEDLGTCTEDLDQCDSDLAGTAAELDTASSVLLVCQEDLGACTQDLATLTADSDRDGRPDVEDVCPGTSPNQEVDQVGCSLRQFCVAIDATTPVGRRECRNSDWRNDEPLMGRGDRDCGVYRARQGPLDDRCVALAP